MGAGTPYRATFIVYGIVCVAVLAASFLVTVLNTSGTIIDLDGTIGRMDHGDLWDSLDPLSAVIYGIGDYCCHQETARSLVFNGNQMPMCIRETFLFLGMAAGFFILSHRTVMPVKERFVLCVVLIMLTPLEWGLEHYLYIGNSVLRAAVSLVSGFAFAGFLSAILEFEYGILDRRKKGGDGLSD